MKAVIPAAGFGTRFLPATKAQPKEMLPVYDKPTIQYVIEEAVASGIDDILIVTGRNKRSIEDHFDKSFELEQTLQSAGKDDRLKQVRAITDLADICYVRQKEQKGLGDAIYCAKKHIGGEPFAVLLGDSITKGPTPCTKQLIDVHEKYDASAISLEAVPKHKVERYGIIKGTEVENNVYNIEIKQKARDILEDLSLMNQSSIQSHPGYEIVSRNCCAASYLAGAFLAYGSCNDPQNPNYHLEISLAKIDYANFIVKLISKFDMQAKIVKRRNRYIVYLKKADYISNFLTLIGAHDAMLRFEDERIGRDLKNSLSRIDNCEIANEEKIIRAGERQINYINKIIESGKFNKLPEKLKNVADIRIRYPESSLLELCDYYQKAFGEVVSKSGMKHRLNKLENIAEALEEWELY